MRRRTHSSDAAARAMGVTTSAVRAWSADQEWPEPEHVAALLEYLQVDERRLRALVLRGQMRRIEDRIRN
jgi:DNA-binding transcriptional regulator YiaG